MRISKRGQVGQSISWCQQDISGKIVTLYCEYENQPAKEVDSDIVVTTGFGVSAGLGAIMGLFVYLVMLIQSRRN
jgi:hypothetical protein